MTTVEQSKMDSDAAIKIGEVTIIIPNIITVQTECDSVDYYLVVGFMGGSVSKIRFSEAKSVDQARQTLEDAIDEFYGVD